MKKLFKKLLAVATAATMLVAMSVTAFAGNGDVYAKFCKDGSDTVSMVQKAVAGACTIEDNGDGTSFVTIPVQSFTHSVEMGSTTISGTGSLTGLTVDGAYYPVENNEITIVADSDLVDADGAGYVDVTVSYTVSMSSIPVGMTNQADLYFSSTLATY